MNATDYGGGTPVADVWRRDVGLAVGHLERIAQAGVAAGGHARPGRGRAGRSRARWAACCSPGESVRRRAPSWWSTGATTSSRWRVPAADGPAGRRRWPEPGPGLTIPSGAAGATGAASPPRRSRARWPRRPSWASTGRCSTTAGRRPRATGTSIRGSSPAATPTCAPSPGRSAPPGCKPDVVVGAAGGRSRDRPAPRSTRTTCCWARTASPARSPGGTPTTSVRPTRPSRSYTRELVTQMLRDWGYEGLKLDGQHLNAAPPCHNPAHGHADPDECVREAARAVPADLRHRPHASSPRRWSSCAPAAPATPFTACRSSTCRWPPIPRAPGRCAPRARRSRR